MNHKPVMIAEVLRALSPQDGETYVDGTFGAGGYTSAILDTADCNVIGIDRDPSVQEFANIIEKKYANRFTFHSSDFASIERVLNGQSVDGIVLDIGVSSMQLDQGERGFSFRQDAPLDMRMNTNNGRTAADIVNHNDETEIANIIYQYGEEKHARRIAKHIVAYRTENPIQTTLQLAGIVQDCYPHYTKNHPATKTFQALRIAVNDELGQLETILESMPRILNKNGRAVVVSFHSLEDRIVKTFFLNHSDQKPRGSRFSPETKGDTPLFTLGKKGAIKPDETEISDNSRARSARLRWAVKL